MSVFFDPKDDEVVDGLVKSEAIMELAQVFLSHVVWDNDAWDLHREAFIGLGHVLYELRWATRDMGEKLKKQFAEALKDVPGIRDIEEIHAHRFGPYLVAIIMITIDGNLRVVEAEAISAAAERKLREDVDMLRRVFIHTHPTRMGEPERP